MIIKTCFLLVLTLFFYDLQATYRCEWQKCARSNKPFTKRHKMYNHLRTHTGERPFACPKPGKLILDVNQNRY